MKKILAIVLIASLFSLCILSNASDADLMNGTIDTGPLIVGTILLLTPIFIMSARSAYYESMQSAWVRADKGTLRTPLFYSDITAFLGKRKIIMKENSWVYPQPNGERYNGAVYKNEIYYIDGEDKTGQGTWYQIKIDAEHVTREAIDLPELI